MTVLLPTLSAVPRFQLKDEPIMKLSRLWSHDGNNSLKHMVLPSDRNAGDTRALEDSDYFLSRTYVDRFAGDVRGRKSKDEDEEIERSSENNSELVEGDPTDGDVNDADKAISQCVKNWKAAAADEKKKMWAIFDETRIFASACRHGLTLWLEDMVKSREL